MGDEAIQRSRRVSARLALAESAYSRAVLHLQDELIHHAMSGDVDAIVEIAKEILEHADSRNAIRRWVKRLRKARAKYVADLESMLKAPEDAAPASLETTEEEARNVTFLLRGDHDE